MMCFGNNSLIISALRSWAQSCDASGSWHLGHLHEAGTTEEMHFRQIIAIGLHRQGRTLNHAADHFKTMWGNV